MQTLQIILLVGCGGAAGAVFRYFAEFGSVRLLGPGFPFGTLFVNVVGSLLVGVLAVLLLEKMTNPRVEAALLTGLLGGFTTFSAFSLETATLVQQDRLMAASSYVIASVGLSLAMVFLGVWLARSWAA